MKIKQKKELLGDVNTQVESSDKSPNLEILKKNENPDTVISAFCKSCGAYHELNFEDGEKIFMVLGQPLIFENRYLLFSSCPECKSEDKTVVLKDF